jgi:hypothetical protein
LLGVKPRVRHLTQRSFAGSSSTVHDSNSLKIVGRAGTVPSNRRAAARALVVCAHIALD